MRRRWISWWLWQQQPRLRSTRSTEDNNQGSSFRCCPRPRSGRTAASGASSHGHRFTTSRALVLSLLSLHLGSTACSCPRLRSARTNGSYAADVQALQVLDEAVVELRHQQEERGLRPWVCCHNLVYALQRKHDRCCARDAACPAAPRSVTGRSQRSMKQSHEE